MPFDHAVARVIEELKKEGGKGTGGHVEVSAIDSIASMQAVKNPKLEGVAQQVQAKLKRVIENL
jgi:hypothetical protein